MENRFTINDLPDSILCKILSLLPTKNAFGTSILSTRWKRLFPFFWIPPISLEFDDSLFLNPMGNEGNSPSRSFIEFVDKLLFETLSEVFQVETISFYCQKYDNYNHDYEDKLMSWVDAALRLNVRRLVINFPPLRYPKELFDRLNGCLTLVRLVLFVSEYNLDVPDDFTLPNLKVLMFGEIGFDDGDGINSINEFIQGCPALSELGFMDCDFLLSGDLVIHSPMLNSLVISGTSGCWEYHLNLDAPNLRALTLKCDAARSYRLTSFNALLDVDIDVAVGEYEQLSDEEGWDDYVDESGTSYISKCVGSIVTACASTTHLSLGAVSIDALHYSAVELPTFQNLTFLSLGCLEYNGWKLLACILHSSPNLQELIFREKFKRNAGYLSFLELVQSPPICLESQIKKIIFCVFEGNVHEVKLLKYFLKNGDILEKAILHCLPSMADNVVKRLYKLPGSYKKIVLKQDRE